MKIAVVHLVRKANGVEPFKKFWDSYRNHDAGEKHDVILIFKGFDQFNKDDRRQYYKIVDKDVKVFPLSDQGNDIDVYLLVACDMHHYDAYVFLNSWSVIKKDGWLKIMSDALKPDVGVSAAFTTDLMHFDNIKKGLAKKTAWYLRPFKYPYILYQYIVFGLFFPWKRYVYARTNGFMVKKELVQKLKKAPWIMKWIFMVQLTPPYFLVNKFDGWMFENGRKSLTKQAESMGYSVVSLNEHNMIGDNRIP
jgi:hypothetical protein